MGHFPGSQSEDSVLRTRKTGRFRHFYPLESLHCERGRSFMACLPESETLQGKEVRELTILSAVEALDINFCDRQETGANACAVYDCCNHSNKGGIFSFCNHLQRRKKRQTLVCDVNSDVCEAYKVRHKISNSTPVLFGSKQALYGCFMHLRRYDALY